MIFHFARYKTKLKAAKAMNTAAMATTEYQKDGPIVPGTNKYTREGWGFHQIGLSNYTDQLDNITEQQDLALTTCYNGINVIKYMN